MTQLSGGNSRRKGTPAMFYMYELNYVSVTKLWNTRDHDQLSSKLAIRVKDIGKPAWVTQQSNVWYV